MNNTVYVYGENSLLKIVIEILFEYKIIPLSLDQLNNENFKKHANTSNTIRYGLDFFS